MMLCINIYVALGLPCQILARWRSPGPPVLFLSPAKKHAGLAVVRAAAGLSDGRVRHSLLQADPRPARRAVLPAAIPAAIPASLFPTWCRRRYWHCHVAVGSVCPPVPAPPGALSAAPCCSPWRSHWRGMVCWQQGGLTHRSSDGCFYPLAAAGSKVGWWASGEVPDLLRSEGACRWGWKGGCCLRSCRWVRS